MPNRILRDWTESDKMEKVSFQAEVLFARLMMKADDFGTYHSNLKLINAACFPLKNIRESDISRWLQELASAGLIVFFDAENKSFLNILNFGQRLRSMKNKFPQVPENVMIEYNSKFCQRVVSELSASCPPETKLNETETETKGHVVVFDGLTFPKSHIEHSGMFIDEKISLETFMQQNVIKKPNQVRESLMNFLKHLNIEGKTYEEASYKDFKKHFLNWFRKQPKESITAVKKNKTSEHTQSAEWLS